MRVINNTMSAVCKLLFYLMIHKVGWKLAGRAAAFYQSPADSVINTFIIQFNDCKTCFRVNCYVSEIFAASGYQEKLSCKSRHLCADRLPLARCIQTGTDHFYFFCFQTIA